MGIVAKRIAMAKSHLKIMENKYTNETNLSIKQSKIYSPKDFLQKPHIKYTNYANLSFKEENTAHAANNLKNIYPNLKTAILNFADYLTPGGGYLNGSGAQEEVLCHESNLYSVLTNFTDFYQWNREHINHHLYQNRAIYSPNIVFTNLDGTLVNKFDVITCAAPCYNRANFDNISYRIACEVLQNRMYFVKTIAEENHVNNLILGAWGAGAFGFRGKEVAKMWHQIWAESSSVENVCFAVIEHISTNNVDIFEAEFS